MRASLLAFGAIGLSLSTLVVLTIPASAKIITTDAELAGSSFCWYTEQEKYGRDHTYIHYYRPYSGQWDNQLSEKGTWAISKDGTVTVRLDGGAKTRRYDVNGGRVKELTNSIINVNGEDGKRC